MGYGELVRGNANFRALWSGQIVSLLGDWFNLIASASLIATLTQSGLAIGSLFVVRMLAPFLVSPVAGVVADRYNRKRVLIAADLGRAVAVLGFLLVREAGDVWLLYALTAVQMGIGGFFFPARNAILPDIVPGRGVGAANAITSATWSAILAFGAAIGGVLSGTWGVYPAFAIDAATFLLSAVLIARIRLDARPGEGGARTVRAALGEYLEGLRYLRAHRDVLATAMHKAASALFMGSVFQGGAGGHRTEGVRNRGGGRRGAGSDVRGARGGHRRGADSGAGCDGGPGEGAAPGAGSRICDRGSGAVRGVYAEQLSDGAVRHADAGVRRRDRMGFFHAASSAAGAGPYPGPGVFDRVRGLYTYGCGRVVGCRQGAGPGPGDRDRWCAGSPFWRLFLRRYGQPGSGAGRQGWRGVKLQGN